MTEFEYRWLQEHLKAKLDHCDGHSGKRKEGYQDAIRVAMSMVHRLKYGLHGEGKEENIQ